MDVAAAAQNVGLVVAPMAASVSLKPFQQARFDRSSR